MALDKLVDSTQLDSDLTSVANAIRTKGGTSASLAFPADFVSAIGDIPAGETIYYASNGTTYIKNVVLPNTVTSILGSAYWYTPNMESISAPGVVTLNTVPFGSSSYNSNQCGISTIDFPNLEVISGRGFAGLANTTVFNLPNLRQITSSSAFRGCGSNAVMTFGSIGHSVEKLVASIFAYAGTISQLTIYVNAASIADIISDVKGNQPWGGTITTLIYRSSVTGEVLS